MDTVNQSSDESDQYNYSVIIIHLSHNPSNNEYNVLMSLSSKYLEYVPIGGCCKKNVLSKIHNKPNFFKQILSDGLRESKEETMDLFNDRYHSILYEDDDCILYNCITKENKYTKYLLFKEIVNIEFTTSNKKCYFIIHYTNEDKICRDILFNQYQRKKMICNIKNRRKDKLYDLPIDYKDNSLIQKLNDLYIFEKTKNNDNSNSSYNRKLYISPYLETLELKWFPIKHFLYNNDTENYNCNNICYNRIYDNKELYHHLFYSKWDELMNYINKQRINIKWLLQYLSGKNLNNQYIINKYYKEQIINFLFLHKYPINNFLLQ